MKERYVIKKILIFVSIIALFAISIAIAIVLIDETSHFLVEMGKREEMALIMAASVALLVFVLPMLPLYRDYFFISTMTLVLIVIVQVVFSGIYANRNILKPEMNKADLKIISNYENQIESIDKSIKIKEKSINVLDSKKYRTKRDNLNDELMVLIEKRNKINEKLNDTLRDSKNNPNTMTNIVNNVVFYGTFLYRALMELGLILLGASIGILFNALVEQREQIIINSSDLQLEQIESKQSKFDSKKKKNTKQIDYQGQSYSEIVKGIYPNAKVISKNGRKGPFTVYSDKNKGVILGSGTTANKAYQDAVKRCDFNNREVG
jgi:hypothetical protein